MLQQELDDSLASAEGSESEERKQEERLDHEVQETKRDVHKQQEKEGKKGKMTSPLFPSLNEAKMDEDSASASGKAKKKRKRVPESEEEEQDQSERWEDEQDQSESEE